MSSCMATWLDEIAPMMASNYVKAARAIFSDRQCLSVLCEASDLGRRAREYAMHALAVQDYSHLSVK